MHEEQITDFLNSALENIKINMFNFKNVIK
jgi:hypothetical protein